MSSIYTTLIFLMFNCTNLIGQEMKTNIYNLNGFGQIPIPKELDTLTQTISKQTYLQVFFDNANNNGIRRVEQLYNINIAKGILSNLDTNVVVFWPRKTLMSLLLLDSTIENDTTLQNSINLVPSVMIKKEKFKLNSAKIKEHFSEKKNVNEMKDFFTETYTKAISLIFPNNTVKSTHSTYFLYKNTFPCFKISITTSSSQDKKALQYTHEMYTLFKNNYNYLFKFEFKTEDINQWIKYEEYFLKVGIFN